MPPSSPPPLDSDLRVEFNWLEEPAGRRRRWSYRLLETLPRPPSQSSQPSQLLISAFKWVEPYTRTLKLANQNIGDPTPSSTAITIICLCPTKLNPIGGDLFPNQQHFTSTTFHATRCHPQPAILTQLYQVKYAELLRIAQEWLEGTVQHWTGQVLQNRQVWLHLHHFQQFHKGCFS